MLPMPRKKCREAFIGLLVLMWRDPCDIGRMLWLPNAFMWSVFIACMDANAVGGRGMQSDGLDNDRFIWKGGRRLICQGASPHQPPPSHPFPCSTFSKQWEADLFCLHSTALTLRNSLSLVLYGFVEA